MRKRIVLFILAAVFAAGSTGCQGKEELTETASTEETVLSSESETASGQPEESTASQNVKTGEDVSQGPLAESVPAVRVVSYYNEDVIMSVGGYCVVTEGFDSLSDALSRHDAQMKENALAYKDSLSEDSEYSYENTAVITRCDTAVFSGYQEEYVNLGQSDARPVTTGYSYDVYSGTELQITDVISDMDLFQKAVLAKLDASADKERFESNWETGIADVITSGDFSWYLKDDSIEVIFASGMPDEAFETQIEILYTECSDFIKERYLNHSEFLCHKIDDYGDSCLEYSFDADGDGQDELLQIGAEYEIEDNYVVGVMPSVSFGRDEGSLITEWGDEMTSVSDAWVIEADDGAYYLYYETVDVDDYHVLNIYDLSDPDKGPVNMGTSSVGAFCGFFPEGPDQIYAVNRIYMMGTYNGYAKCSIGDGGQLTTGEDEPEYRILCNDENSYFESDIQSPGEVTGLTLKSDLNEYVYDITDGSGDEKTIPAGTVLYPYSGRIDAYMVFRISDKEYVTLYYDEADEDSLEHTIKGIPESELLDGILYAG